MPGGGLGWGRVGRGEGLGGGIMTSIRRAHMHKLLAFTTFLIILRGEARSTMTLFYLGS